MKSAKFKFSEGTLGATIVGIVMITGMVAAVIFASNNAGSARGGFASGNKYPAKAFVVKRLGSLKANTVSENINSTSGLSVDVNYDEARQKLKLKITDPSGKPMKRVSVNAHARKVGQQQQPRRFDFKEYAKGEYRSDALGLEKGGWVLSVSAYDLYARGENKLLFHTERPLFVK